MKTSACAVYKRASKFNICTLWMWRL